MTVTSYWRRREIRNKGDVPPVKCATGLRYIPDRRNPYSLKVFDARGKIVVGTKKEQMV